MSIIKRTIRGIREVIPPGYVIGRTSTQNGPAELVRMGDLAQNLVNTGIVPAAVNFATEYLGFSSIGPFTTLQQFAMAAAPRNVGFPSKTLSSNLGSVTTPPTADFTCVLTNNLADYLANGTSIVCSVKFLAGTKVGVFTYGASITIPFGAVMYLVMPAAADATLSGMQILFAGTPL